MGDAVIMNSVFSSPASEARVTADAIPAAALARWAAIAGERARFTAVPRQHEAA